MDTQKAIVSTVGVVALVTTSLVCAGVMVALRPAAARVDAEVVATPVEVTVVHEQELPARIHANGTVQPAQRVALVPEVGGKIVYVAPQLAPGARFAKGEVIARVDARDYELGVRVEQSRVHQAEVELQLEEGRGRVAQREWEVLQGGEQANPLALRGPQLEQAKRGLEAARSGLDRAQLSLERTRLTAPFNAVVIDENLDVGQVIGPGSPVATLVGTDRFWVKVAVPVSELAWVDVAAKPVAHVRQQVADGMVVARTGQVLQLGGELDPQTRTASVIVAIDAPMEGEGLPLLPGAYVEVEIEGRPAAGVFELPRSSVRDGAMVLVVGPGDKLERRRVDLAWGDGSTVTVRGDLRDGERVITSAIATPIDGMPVRVLDGGRAGDANDAAGRL